MPELSQTGAFPFTCEGGLVLNQSTFTMKPVKLLSFSTLNLILKVATEE